MIPQPWQFWVQIAMIAMLLLTIIIFIILECFPINAIRKFVNKRNL